MASSSTVKAPCATCGSKSVGIFKCEGCTQLFCRKHVSEHRDILSQRLDEIVIEHDTLQQIIIEKKDQVNYNHPVLKQIDEWQKNSIMKIHQTAEIVRQQLNELIISQQETVSEGLHDLAERLRKARVDEDYIETDLCTWTATLEKIKQDIDTVSSSITLYENPKKTLISEVYISATKQQLKLDEIFGESHGKVRIEDTGHIAKHCGSKRNDVFLRGKQEYSSGKHRIRFVVYRQTSEYLISFGIIPKLMRLSEFFNHSTYTGFGWRSNDSTHPPNTHIVTKKRFRDLMGKTMFEIELLIDCDNQMISYFNQRTKNTRQMLVDIQTCPFPWQLLFYLYDVGDYVRLISSNDEQ